MSRNAAVMLANLLAKVTPREGRVSRNVKEEALTLDNDSHAPRGACE